MILKVVPHKATNGGDWGTTLINEALRWLILNAIHLYGVPVLALGTTPVLF